MKKTKLYLLMISMILASCGGEEFGSNKFQEKVSTPGIASQTSTSCSSFTLIKPPVDFLFLWDNSTSQNYMEKGLKDALADTVTKISERFDYRIVLVPINANGLDSAQLIADNPDSLTYAGRSILTTKANAVNALSTFPPSGGNTEEGVDRARLVLQKGYAEGIFRKKAHTIIVLMSNGDNRKDYSEAQTIENAKVDATELKSYAANLEPLQFRFMTLVPHQSCAPAGTNIYRSSGYITATGIVGGGSISKDICAANGDYTHILDEVNNSIDAVLVEHKYDHWPVVLASQNKLNFDPDKIEVYKYLNGGSWKLTQGTHWEYVGFKLNQNTRYEPTPEGEPYTGYFVQLKGNGRVTYPECISVKTQEIAVCYDYLKINSAPKTSTIALVINGKKVEQSSLNGWSYVGYRPNQKVTTRCSGSNYDPDAKYESGHFLKLNGDAIFGNGSDVSVTYEPEKI